MLFDEAAAYTLVVLFVFAEVSSIGVETDTNTFSESDDIFVDITAVPSDAP